MEVRLHCLCMLPLLEPAAWKGENSFTVKIKWQWSLKWLTSTVSGKDDMTVQTDPSWEILLPHENINGVIRILSALCLKAVHINGRTPKYSNSVCSGVRLIVHVKGNCNCKSKGLIGLARLGLIHPHQYLKKLAAWKYNPRLTDWRFAGIWFLDPKDRYGTEQSETEN